VARQGIDIRAGGKIKKAAGRPFTSPNVYLKLLLKLYSFLARRTGSKATLTIAQRLGMSRMNRPPITLKHLAKHMKERLDKTCVIVGGILDDPLFQEVPKMRVCALRFTESARARIEKSGGECLTLDQLAASNPKLENVVLLRGKRTAREACKHFGPAPGAKGSTSRPYVRAKGRKFEKARGRRKSRGFKV